MSRGPTPIGKPTCPYLQCAKGGIIFGLDSWFHMSVFFDLFESLLPVSHLHVPEDRVEYLAGAVVSLSPAFARLQILIRVNHNLPGLGKALEQFSYDPGSERTLLYRILNLSQF